MGRAKSSSEPGVRNFAVGKFLLLAMKAGFFGKSFAGLSSYTAFFVLLWKSGG